MPRQSTHNIKKREAGCLPHFVAQLSNLSMWTLSQNSAFSAWSFPKISVWQWAC